MSVPPRFRLRTSDHCAGSISKTVLSGGTTAPGRLPPAPFTRASTVPHFSRISSRARSHDSLSRTSHFTAIPSNPFSRQYSRASASLSSLRPKNATRAPQEARYRAVPPARTPVAPVTATTFFSMSNKSFIKLKKISDNPHSPITGNFRKPEGSARRAGRKSRAPQPECAGPFTRLRSAALARAQNA